MSNKKITDLTELTNPTTDDVFPVVDIATNTTQKVQLGNLPTTSAVTSALASKQATLVSGTNIKTVNGTSVLGSGDINIPLTPPSGVSGAIQFSTGSAFASDATNLFWDDTNNRLGVGTNAPTAILQAQNATNGVLLARFKDANAVTSYIDIKNDATLNEYTGIYWGTEYRILSKAGNPMFINCSNGINFADGFSTKMVVTPSEVQIGSISGARVAIKGSGSTSATTSLLVQNSSGSTLLSLRDDKVVDFNSATILGVGTLYSNAVALGFINSSGNAYSVMRTNNSTGDATFDQFVAIGTTSAPNASAALDVVSTTKGFLPPRMTTTQRDLISSVATGLVLYNTTTNKLQCYNGSTWNDLF